MTSAFLKLVKTPETIPENLDNLVTELAVYDKELAERGSKFFAGKKFNTIDFKVI